MRAAAPRNVSRVLRCPRGMRARTPRSPLTLATLALGTALALSACGSETSSGDGPATTGSTTTATTATTTPSDTGTTPPSTASALPTPAPPKTTPPTTAPGPDQGGLPSGTGAPVTVTGIPQEGTEPSCLGLGGYELSGGDRALLTSGRSVTVTGRVGVGMASHCQMGKILVVESVVAAT